MGKAARRRGEASRHATSPEYAAWGSMVQRCTNPKQYGYKWYGARGITVCDEWRGEGGYERFLAHIGRKPTLAHTLDRIDSAKNYEPGNVRWATMQEQQRNRSNNRYITAYGETLLLQEWAVRLGCSHSTILTRINRRGWDAERAVTTPVLHPRPRGHPKPPKTGALRGERHARAKLTEEQVRGIRALRGQMRRADVAAQFGVSVSTIKGIWCGRLWRHLLSDNDSLALGILSRRAANDSKKMLEQRKARGGRVKERPILFKGPLVRAILEGKKTQTRRLVDPRSFAGKWLASHDDEDAGARNFVALSGNYPPYEAGLRLWARETWGLCSPTDVTDWHRGSVRGYSAGRALDRWQLEYAADWGPNQESCFWRPSIHMPRWASRILLEVTEVRVERLQDISDKDVKAEGVALDDVDSKQAHFRRLWDSLNAKRAPWDSNPWVWVVSFRRGEA